MPGKPGPKPLETLPPEELEAVEALMAKALQLALDVMKAEGISRTELTRLMGLSRKGLDLFFAPKPQDSRLSSVARIFHALGYHLDLIAVPNNQEEIEDEAETAVDPVGRTPSVEEARITGRHILRGDPRMVCGPWY